MKTVLELLKPTRYGGDRVDWVDTATQAADCLTMSMKLDFIIKVIDSGVYNVSRAKL